MTIKDGSSPRPPLSFSEIAAEFGNPIDNKLGNYRNTTSKSGGWDLGSLPFDTGIPTSGSIKFSDFYNKQLNIVVKCYGGDTVCPDYRVNAKSQWDNDKVVVVGERRK